MKPAGFTAFLKLLELPDNRRKTELRRKQKGGGGFQYWRPLQIAAPKALWPAANIEALRTEIDNLSSGPQRTYNKNAFASFCKWKTGEVLKPTTSLPIIDVPFGNSGLIVRIRPDVSFEIDGQLFSMTLWATTKPLLSGASLSVGLKFSSDSYKERGHTTHRHLILDTITNKLFREEDILANVGSLLMQKVEAFRKDIESFGPSPSLSPDSPSDHPIP